MLLVIGRFSWFTCQVVVAMPRAALDPRRVLAPLTRVAAGAAAMALIIGFALGVVCWLHLGDTLRRFELEAYLPSLLMLAVVMEFGPVSAGLIASSRLAAGIAAELAGMQNTEQLDALAVLGVSAHQQLYAPRTLACIVLLPMLTVLVDYSALAGSFLVEWNSGGLSWSLYYQAAIQRLSLSETILATAKSAVFGFVVGVVASWFGAICEPGAESVGNAATRAVVFATLAVLVGNVALVRIIQIVT